MTTKVMMNRLGWNRPLEVSCVVANCAGRINFAVESKVFQRILARNHRFSTATKPLLNKSEPNPQNNVLLYGAIAFLASGLLYSRHEDIGLKGVYQKVRCMVKEDNEPNRYNSWSFNGISRSLYFWSHAFPIYLRYRCLELKCQYNLLTKEEEDEEFKRLHHIYAPKAIDIVINLKGFYVKLAQIGATREDFLPEQYLRGCKAMQDKVPAKSIDDIRRIIEEDFGKPADEIFSQISESPLGAASIGQVHRCTLKDGRDAVVKVQYPEAEKDFYADIHTIKSFCRLAQPGHLPFLEEVEKQFMTEFDYRGECKNLEEVRNNLLNSVYKNKVVVPKPISELCTKNVLVMEYLEGTKLLDAVRQHFDSIAAERGMTFEQLKKQQIEIDAQRRAQGLDIDNGATEIQLKFLSWKIWLKSTFGWLNPFLRSPSDNEKKVEGQVLNLPKILRLLLDVHGHEIFVDGCFNGDPHPGNILLLKDGKIGLIDYGQVKRINDEQRANLSKFVIALAEGSQEEIAWSLNNDLGISTKRNDPYVLEKLARLYMDRDDRSVTEGRNPQLFMEYLESLDPIKTMADEYVMAFRVSLLLRAFSHALRYDMSHAEAWAPIAKRVLEHHKAKEEHDSCHLSHSAPIIPPVTDDSKPDL